MKQVVDFLMGPAFIFSFTLMVLGLVRIIIISIWGMKNAVAMAGDKTIPYKMLIKETLSWIFPFKHLLVVRPVFSAMSFLFHIGLIIVPLLLLDHILLWGKIGLWWPNIPQVIADILTLCTIIGCVFLLSNRIFHKNTRFISSGIDYTILVMILIIFSSGFIASRTWSPLPHEASMLIHTLFGNLILIMIPFSKLAHCVLYPLLRVASNIAWHFPARAGEKINKTLYGEEVRKI